MRLSLLLEDDLDDVAAAVTRLRVLLPSDIPVDAFVQLYPQVLDVKDFEQAMKVTDQSTCDAPLCLWYTVLCGGIDVLCASCTAVDLMCSRQHQHYTVHLWKSKI